MSVRDYLEIARERLLVVIAIVLVTTAAVVGLLLVQAPEQRATVRLRARPPAPGAPANVIAEEQQQQTDLGTEAELLRSSKVAERVADDLDIPGDADDLLDRVQATPMGTTAVLLITATADTAEEAVALANSFAEHYLEVRRETLADALDVETASLTTQLRNHLGRLSAIDQVLANAPQGSAESVAALAERDQVVADMTVARARLDALADRAAVDAGFGEILQTAKEASASRSQSVPRAVVFGFLLGIPLALAAVLVLDSLNNDVRTASDVARAAGADVVGVIPLDPGWQNAATPRLVTSDAPLSPTAEAYRRLSFTLARYADAAGVTSVLITSPGDGEGKTATVANLAVAAADAGRRTRIVEADLRHPRLHTFFDAPGSPGLADVLAGEVELSAAVQELAFGLDLLPAGRATERPDLLVSRGELEPVLDGVAPVTASGRPARGRLRASSNLVLVDSPSIIEAAEVSRLAAAVGAVILVARVRATSKQSLAAAAEQVRRAGGNVLGVVLVGARSVTEPVAAGAPNDRD